MANNVKSVCQSGTGCFNFLTFMPFLSPGWACIDVATVSCRSAVTFGSYCVGGNKQLHGGGTWASARQPASTAEGGRINSYTITSGAGLGTHIADMHAKVIGGAALSAPLQSSTAGELCFPTYDAYMLSASSNSKEIPPESD